MKLKNKKTGEIIETQEIYENLGGKIRIRKKAEEIDSYEYMYNSLAELNEEWQDYEEPKEHWHIRDGEVYRSEIEPCIRTEKRKEIGNYFVTKEEAKKAVEKLKAWKRLKDKEFRFIDHIDRDIGQGMTRYEWNGYIDGEDLDLLFGGEE